MNESMDILDDSGLSKMINQYYKEQEGKDLAFCFMHVGIKYTFLDNHHKVLDLNNGGIIKETVERVTYNDTLHIPILMDRAEYERKLAKDVYNSEFILNIPNTIDIGSSDEFRYDSVYDEIGKIIPSNYKIISDEEFKKIATLNGYDDIKMEIKSMVKYPFTPEPSWCTYVYLTKQKYFNK